MHLIFLGVWIPLEDVTTIHNGTLWIIPKSHLQGILFSTKKHQMNDEFEWEDECCGFDESQAIPVEVKGGDMLVFNGYMLHRSLRNNSERSRRVLSCHYMSMNSAFSPWIPASTRSTYIGIYDDRKVVPVLG